MKKIILLVVVALFAFTTNAQDKDQGLKGAWWGMGQFEYNSVKDGASSFSVVPVVGTFVTPTITVGAGVGIGSEKSHPDTDAVNTITVMPLARKYFGVSDKFFIFAQAAVPLKFNEFKDSLGFQLSPGIDYFIGGKWTIEATFGAFGYSSRTIKAEGVDDVKVSEIDFGFNTFAPAFGIKYLF